MSNAHSFDHCSSRKTMAVTVKSWPDDYYEVDFSMTAYEGSNISACLPLVSGKRPITHDELAMIKSLLMNGLATIITLDFEEEPF